MNSNTLILVNKNDKKLGYASLEEAHTDNGKRHRAFATLLFNSQNQVLLQKRKHRLFDGFWDFTAISHNLHQKGRDESYQQASDRALFKEMGIRHVSIKNLGGFEYFAKDGKNCENEYCAVLTGSWEGKIKPNTNEVYETEWVDYSVFLSDISNNPKKYTHWAVESTKLVEKFKQSSFLTDISWFSENFKKYSSAFFVNKKKLVSKYPSLIGSFYQNLEDFGTGGKAMRPYLVYLGYKLGGGNDLKKVLPVCMAIELIHNFLLIHDDIIDKSSTRRSKPTLHKRYEKFFGSHYGISQAIIVGDIAMIEAFELLNGSNFDKKVKGEFVNLLSNYLLETAYGQALDVEYSFRRPSLAKVMRVAELKTARYSFVGPLGIGAKLAGATSKQIKAIGKYGTDVGIAFQLQDDILGVFGDETVLGKSTLSDMREGKNTVLFYKTREMVNAGDLKTLETIWGRFNATRSDLRKAQQIIRQSGAYEWCRKKMVSFVASAKKTAAEATANKKLLAILQESADFVIARNK